MSDKESPKVSETTQKGPEDTPTAKAQAADSPTPPPSPPPAAPAPKRPGVVRRFIRSVVSHLLVALAVLVAVLGYLYYKGYISRDKVLAAVGNYVCHPTRLGAYVSLPMRAPAPQMAAVSEGTDDKMSAAKTPPAQPADTDRPAPTAATPPPMTAKEPAAESQTEGEPQTVAASQETPSTAAQPGSQPGTSPKQPEMAGDKASETPPDDAEQVTPPQTPSTADAAEPGNQAETPSTTPTPTAAPEITGPSAPHRTPPEGMAAKQPAKQSLAAAWQAARKAYLAGKPEAIAQYKALIAAYPHVADLPGELGNIYYQEGLLREAGEQYFEAAIRHLRGPRPGMAACLLPVLQRIAPEKAQALKPKLTSPCPRQ